MRRIVLALAAVLAAAPLVGCGHKEETQTTTTPPKQLKVVAPKTQTVTPGKTDVTAPTKIGKGLQKATPQ